MEEIWKEYKTYCTRECITVKSDIEISNFGNVRGSLWNGKPLKEVYVKDNRRRLSNGHCGQIFILVWTVFNGPIPKGYVIHHKDHNSLNDRLDNLELMTKAEHVSHHKKGIKRQPFSEEWRRHLGEKSKITSLGNTNCKDYVWYNNGIKTRRFKTKEEANEAGFLFIGRLSLKNNKNK